MPIYIQKSLKKESELNNTTDCSYLGNQQNSFCSTWPNY